MPITIQLLIVSTLINILLNFLLWIIRKSRGFTVLASISMKSLSISEAARQMGVSRQATQKTASKLIEKEYVTFRQLDDNKRDKYMFLTPTGKTYIELSQKMKLQIEDEIMNIVGAEKIMILKETLLSL